MFIAYHLYGGTEILRKLKTGESLSKGQMTRNDTANDIGEVEDPTTTSALGYGVALDNATHSTVQGVGNEGKVTVDLRADAIIRARLSGGATVGTSMPTLTNTVQDTTGLTISAADVSASEMNSGTVWRINPGGQSSETRIISEDTDNVSIVVTVPFSSIEVGDTFMAIPQSFIGAGGGAFQLTTDFTEIDGDIVSGTGVAGATANILAFGVDDSFIDFISHEHAMGADILA